MKFGKHSSMLAAAAAIAMASLPFAGAQTEISPRPGYSTPRRDKPRHPRDWHQARQASAAAKRARRCARNLRLAARGAYEHTMRSYA